MEKEHNERFNDMQSSLNVDIEELRSQVESLKYVEKTNLK